MGGDGFEYETLELVSNSELLSFSSFLITKPNSVKLHQALDGFGCKFLWLISDWLALSLSTLYNNTFLMIYS